MGKVHKALGKRKTNLLCICISVGVYIANNYLIKNITQGFFRYICVNYLNDFMCPLFFLGVSEILLIYADVEIQSLGGILMIICAAGFVWEIIGPIININSVGDCIDFVCYIIGGIVYYSILKIESTLHYKKDIL